MPEVGRLPGCVLNATCRRHNKLVSMLLLYSLIPLIWLSGAADLLKGCTAPAWLCMQARKSASVCPVNTHAVTHI